MNLKPHRYSASVARSKYTVKAQGVALDVLHHVAADHASFEAEDSVEIEIEIPAAPKKVTIRPLRLGIEAKIEDKCVRFAIKAPQHLQIEIEGHPLLYIYAQPFAQEAPAGRHVKHFVAGQIHDAGLIILKDNETCWIEAGAIVRGSIRAENAKGVQIGGYGILDGSIWKEQGKRCKGIVLDHCSDSHVDDILMLSPFGWLLVLGNCEQIEVKGVRQIATDYGSDGIDVCGSRHVRISGCCLHNGDDNIAIKAVRNVTSSHERPEGAAPLPDWKRDVEDVAVSGCIFYNTHGGSAMEIGYETSTEHIRDIHFKDIDVLAVHEFGSVFGIHNGDRACVENVSWDDIRIEHHFDLLVDFRTLISRWNIDTERGSVRNVTVKNVRALKSIHNDGYTVSIISGYNANHPVTDVTFENFELGGRKIANADDLDLVTRHAHNVTFR